MTGARSPLREQNPAYRACTLPRASFRMQGRPFSIERTAPHATSRRDNPRFPKVPPKEIRRSGHPPAAQPPPGQSPATQKSFPKQFACRFIGLLRHSVIPNFPLRKVSQYTTFIKTAHFNIVSTRFQSYFDMKYKKPRISPIRRQKNFQRGFSCPNTSPYIYIKTGNI